MDASAVQWRKHGTNAVLVFLLLLVYQYVVESVDPPFLVAAAILYFVVLAGFDLVKHSRGWGEATDGE